MDTPPANEAPRPRRLLILGIMVGLSATLALIAVWQFLPLLAPQFVIRHSPWIWPIIRAEAYEMEGRKPDPARHRTGPDPVTLIDRLYDEDWVSLAVPQLAAALDHPDLRLRRTAAQTLLTISEGDSLVDLRQHALGTRLLRLLDDPDPEVFSYAFALLQNTTDAAIAQAMLPHLPRACGLTGDEEQRIRWGDEFDEFTDQTHPMQFLRFARLVDAVMPWLDSEDEQLQRLACATLGFSDDPRALDQLITRLGRYSSTDDHLDVGDPVAYGLSESRDPRATAMIHQAMGDPVAARRLSAVRAAHRRAAPESLAILNALVDDPDLDVRVEVAKGLAGSYPLEQTLDGVIAIIARGGPPATHAISMMRMNLILLGFRLRRKAVYPMLEPREFLALKGLVFTRLTALLPRSEPAVRVAIIEYLGVIGEHGGDEVRRCLGALADDADPQVRTAVATAQSRVEELLKRR